MSLQFGKWNFDGQPVAPEYVEKVCAALEPYGPDSNEKYSKDGAAILFRAFHTTKESRSEVQPHISCSGAVITWDGRLDNRKELIGELQCSLATDLTDVAIVAAAYERWGEHCFGKVIGDWALSIWNPKNRSLVLAKDPIGTRHLYYWTDGSQVTWSTILDPLVRLAHRTFDLNKEYVAGLLSTSMFPAAHLTPCLDVHSVPPSSLVVLRPGKHTVSKYWDFDPGIRIRYRRDAEYEEHFRTVFAQSVQRRLRSDGPVLAELSGGRDSSSIVCMADKIISGGQAECPRLDTISFYDDSEPNWNERPYFTKVEEKRGRTGWHINVGQPDLPKTTEPDPYPDYSPFAPMPGVNGRTAPTYRACLTSQANRVVLSGIGGDEVMGGVPTAAPEFQDLLARGHFGALAHQLKIWALEKRKPWLHLFWEAAREFLPAAVVGVPKHLQAAPWLNRRFAKQHRAALTGYPARTKLFGSLPSLQSNLATLDAMRKELTCTMLPFGPTFEKRYPYLDRDLLEFMFAIPRTQLVRPTQRRSLMRRALAGIVPDEILNRKRKAFVARSPLKAISQNWAHLMEITQNMVSSSLGIVDAERIQSILQKGRQGEEIPIITLNRMLFLEGWLKDLQASNFIRINSMRKPDLAAQAMVQGIKG